MTLQEEYDQLQNKLIRATTLRDEAIRKLKEDFECSTVEEAEELLTKLQGQIEEKEQQLAKRLKQFRSKYASLLEDKDEELD